jgi:glycosyltransferase involved in cell wall biosynthesis
MQIAWYTPLPPMASGIADYSFELLPVIARRARVDAVTPRGRWPKRTTPPPGIRRVEPAVAVEGAASYDATVYHLGNNPFHEFVYEAALARPGIVVLHDFVMHHLIAHLMIEGGRQRQRYTRLMQDEYGEAGVRLVDLRLHRIATDYEKFVFPLNRHVVLASQAVIVHSEDSADRIRALVPPTTSVSVIPHHASRAPRSLDGVDRRAARARLGLPGDAFLVGHFGYLTRPKQPAAVIGGFEVLARARQDARLILTGADHTGGGIDRTIRRHGLDGRVVKAGYVDLERFYLYLRAVDATINLRYPSAGESSGTFARALAEGRAAIVNDLGSFAEVPDDVALKVEIDGDQAAQVGAHLVRLAGDPEFRRGIEARARDYASTVLSPERCADLYVQAAVASGSGSGMARGASGLTASSR